MPRPSTNRTYPLPSVETLMRLLGPYPTEGPYPRSRMPLSRPAARVIRRRLEEWRACTLRDDNDPRSSYAYPRVTAEDTIRYVDNLLGTYGVEGMPYPNDCRYGVSYCNTGDTYGTTLLYDSYSRRWHVTSFGDYIESDPARWEE